MFLDSISRSSFSEVFCEEDFLKTFTILRGKHLCWSLFLTLVNETPALVFSCEYFVNAMLKTYNRVRDHIFSENFLAVVIHQYFVFVYMQRITYMAFPCVNLLLFLLPFIMFNVLLPFCINWKPNFKISFGFLTIKWGYAFFSIFP